MLARYICIAVDSDFLSFFLEHFARFDFFFFLFRTAYIHLLSASLDFSFYSRFWGSYLCLFDRSFRALIRYFCPDALCAVTLTSVHLYDYEFV